MFFHGESLVTLRPLLENGNILVQKSAIFVVSELGPNARGLVDVVIPMLSLNDRYILYHAMEIIAVCCTDERAQDFWYVLEQLDSGDAVLRRHAMHLASRVSVEQIKA